MSGVTDGDTVMLVCRSFADYVDVIARLEGVDAPEIGRARCAGERQQGEKARDFAIRWSAEAHHRVEWWPVGRDQYGRSVGRLRSLAIPSRGPFVWRDLGEDLVNAGLAKLWNGRGVKPGWCD